MSRASTEMELKRTKMLAAVEKLDEDSLRAMLRVAVKNAVTYDMDVMAAAVFEDFDDMEFTLDL